MTPFWKDFKNRSNFARARALARSRAANIIDAYDPDTGIVVPAEFDDVPDEEITAISAEIGATGARRPASE